MKLIMIFKYALAFPNIQPKFQTVPALLLGFHTRLYAHESGLINGRLPPSSENKERPISTVTGYGEKSFQRPSSEQLTDK